jgi:hypothetical protein
MASLAALQLLNEDVIQRSDEIENFFDLLRGAWRHEEGFFYTVGRQSANRNAASIAQDRARKRAG